MVEYTRMLCIIRFLPFFWYGFGFHCWRYNFNSIESQIRVLGDYAFMLRDYELALSNYRLISTDYKIDKAWKRYAGVQVIIVIIFHIPIAEGFQMMMHGLNIYYPFDMFLRRDLFIFLKIWNIETLEIL